MQSNFDWLRLAATGAELLATLDLLANAPETLAMSGEGAPVSALDGPCERCWRYPRRADDQYCAACRAILNRRKKHSSHTRQMALVWGYVNRLPRELRTAFTNRATAVFNPDRSGHYLLDNGRFLLTLPKRSLQAWLHDLLLYDGGAVRGLLQIFPTTGVQHNLCMSDLLCRIVGREAVLGMDQLNIRFYALPYHVLTHHSLEEEGLLTYSAAEFSGMLEMAIVFRQLLRPQEQDILQELLMTDDLNQEQFYWGRFLGMLSQEARDMLHAWQVRRWSREQVKLFYQLIHYVYVDFAWMRPNK